MCVCVYIYIYIVHDYGFFIINKIKSYFEGKETPYITLFIKGYKCKSFKPW